MYDINKSFKKNLKFFRKKCGLSQLEFADKANISSGYYAELESENNKRSPSLKVVDKIAKTLKIPVTYLFNDNAEECLNDAISQIYTHISEISKEFSINQPDDFSKCADFITKNLSDLNYTPNDIHKILISVNEIILNAYEHGNKNNPEKHITIIVYANFSEIQMLIQDEGDGFDLSQLPDPTDIDRLIYLMSQNNKNYMRGRGIWTAAYYMDSIKFMGKGNIVELVKYNENSDVKDILFNLNKVTINSWAKLAEYKDHSTGGHLKRIPEYVKVITTDLSQLKKYRYYISEKYKKDLVLASLLHDIGKIAVPDNILLKPGKLTQKEFSNMKKHVLYGEEFLNGFRSDLIKLYPHIRTYFDIAINISKYHHENWDGSGYFKGLKKNDIPLSARIVSVSDVFDALTSNRPYRKAFSFEEAVDLIRKNRGKKFDPEIVDVFVSRKKKIIEISQHFN